MKDKNVDQWRCGELAHVTAAANGGWPEIKRDMGSFIILAQSRSGTGEGATLISSKWLVVFDPLAQVCQNSCSVRGCFFCVTQE